VVGREEFALVFVSYGVCEYEHFCLISLDVYISLSNLGTSLSR
jgi:hypothetical protein